VPSTQTISGSRRRGSSWPGEQLSHFPLHFEGPVDASETEHEVKLASPATVRRTKRLFGKGA